MPKVWNKRDPNCPKDAIYVGRPTKWGNPFIIGKDGTREEVIEKYRNRLNACDPLLLKEFLAPLAGKDLVCWCSPKPCHADILNEIVNS